MPRFYRRVMGQTLLSRIEQALAEPAAEQMALIEELALMREGAANAVALYSEAEAMHAAAVASGNRQMTAETRQALLDAGALMQDNLDRVGDYVLRIARVEALSKDTVTVHALHHIVSQITRIFYVVCGEEYEHLAREVEQRVKEELIIPGTGNEAGGTTITPDQVVLAMDDTVPRA